MQNRTKTFKSIKLELKSLQSFVNNTQKKTISVQPQSYFIDNLNIFIKTSFISAMSCLDAYFCLMLEEIKEGADDVLKNNGFNSGNLIKNSTQRKCWTEIISALDLRSFGNQIILERQSSLEVYRNTTRKDAIHYNQTPSSISLTDVLNIIDNIIHYLVEIDREILKRYRPIRDKLI